MTRQGFVRVLLSLLLLISQQMATAHVLSHLSGSLQHSTAQSSQQDEGLSGALAQDQTCNQCLAFAQLAGPLSNTPRAFCAPDLSALSFQPVDAPATGARIILGFQSRAPPQA